MQLKSLVKAILFVSFVTGVAVSDEVKYYYVHSDVANIRNTPSRDGSIIARLRISTGFYSSRDSGEWIFVDSAQKNYSQLPIQGWINASSCTDKRVDSKYIERGLKESKTFSDTLMWCERMVALQPDNQLYLKALQKGYMAKGDTLRVADIGRKIRGKDPVYLAQVKDSLILLRGVIDSSGEFRSLEWSQVYNSEKKRWEFDSNIDSGKIIKKEAQQIRLALAGLPWYQQFENYPNWIFPAPFIFPTESMVQTDATNPDYYMDISGYSTFAICLGKIKPGTFTTEEIFTTRPTYRVKNQGLSKKTDYDSILDLVSEILSSPIDSIQIESLYFNKLPEYGFLDIALQCISLHEYKRVFRGIFDGERTMVWPKLNEEGGYIYNSFNELFTRWFRFGPDASFPAFTVAPFTSGYSIVSRESSNGNFGDHLIRIKKTETKISVIRSEYAGD